MGKSVAWTDTIEVGAVLICQCGGDGHGHVIIVGENAIWAKNDNGTWTECAKEMTSITDPLVHPDPDAMHADLAAAQLMGNIEQ